MSAEYPTPEEAFGPGERRRAANYYDAIRDARSEARYDDERGEPDTREVSERSMMPTHASESSADGLVWHG